MQSTALGWCFKVRLEVTDLETCNLLHLAGDVREQDTEPSLPPACLKGEYSILGSLRERKKGRALTVYFVPIPNRLDVPAER